MSAETPETGVRMSDEIDLGAPVHELRDLSWAVDPRFADRIRGRIERRVLASELLDFAWSAPLMMLLELLRLPLEVLAGRRRSE